MKRILLLNYEFPPLGGGAANALKYLLKEFKEQGEGEGEGEGKGKGKSEGKNRLQIDCVVSSEDEYLKEQFSNNITIHKLNVGKKGNNLHYQTKKNLLLYSIKSLFYSFKLARKNSYHLIHAWFSIPCGFIAMLLSLIFKIPYIISLRGSDVPFYNPRFSKLDHWLFAPLNKHLIWSNAAEVISNSQWLKKLAQKTAPEQKIITIPNGVDTSQFKPLKGNQQESNAFNIICVSRLVKRKRIDLVIKAVAALENKDLKLTIIGTGKEKHSLSSLVDKLGVNNQVVFLHNVAHHKIVEHYQQSDLFVLPSLSEGMSNSLLEALSCGLPVIVSQTGGVKELVKENGIVLKTATPGSLKKAIVDLYQNKEKQKRMGRASRKIAKQYSWGKSADQYLKIYQNYFSA